MANNRLYIVDPTTGDKILFAKAFGDGRQIWEPNLPRLNEGLSEHDSDACYGSIHAPTSLQLKSEGQID